MICMLYEGKRRKVTLGMKKIYP